MLTRFCSNFPKLFLINTLIIRTQTPHFFIIISFNKMFFKNAMHDEKNNLNIISSAKLSRNFLSTIRIMSKNVIRICLSLIKNDYELLWVFYAYAEKTFSFVMFTFSTFIENIECEIFVSWK